MDSSPGQRPCCCWVNSTHEIVGDVVGKHIGEPVEGVVNMVCICEGNDDGVVERMLSDQLLAERRYLHRLVL